MLDEDAWRRAVAAKAPRFDGQFVVAAAPSGTYCRPSCSEPGPRSASGPASQRIFPTPAGAQTVGYRAYWHRSSGAVPGSPARNSSGDLVERVMRLVADGIVDREGPAGLVRRLATSAREIEREFVAALGAGPRTLAREQRAETARSLLESSSLTPGQVAASAGFATARELDATMGEIFATSSADLRRRFRERKSAERGTGRAPEPGRATTLTLRLACRPPIDFAGLFSFLSERAVPGVEEGGSASFARVLTLPHGHATVQLLAGDSDDDVSVIARLRLDDMRDVTPAIGRCRRLLDLDADPVAVASVLSSDPLLAPLVKARPGLRVPGSVDPFECAVRAVIGQQISVSGARTIAGRLAAAHGDRVRDPDGALTTAFPRAEAIASLDPDVLPLPGVRARALVHLAEVVASGSLPLHVGADRDEVDRALRAISGIGPWTAGYVRLRGLSDPDAYLEDDLGVRHALEAYGEPASPRDALARAEAWRPWRAYAFQHLLTTLEP